MTKFATVQNNFTAGEIDKKLDGRVDIANYKNGVDSIENMLPQYYGGATRRVGTRNVTDTTYVRTIPYVYSELGTTANYVITFTFSASGASLVKAIHSETGSVLSNNFQGTTANNFFLDTSAYLTLGGSGMYEIDYTQVGNLLFLADKAGKYQPLVCYINPAGEFEMTPFLEGSLYTRVGSGVHGILRRPYSPTNIDLKFLKPSGVTAGTSVTLTAYSDAAGTILISDFFTADHVGKHYRLTHGAQEGVGLVTGYTSGSQVTVFILDTVLAGSGGATSMDFGGTTPTDVWSEDLWDNVHGFPRTVTAHEDRLYWGGTPAEPDHIWATQKENFFLVTGDRLKQDEGAAADVSGLRFWGEEVAIDAFGFLVVNKEINDIRWMYGGRSLLIGTSTGEFVADGGNETMSRTNPPFIKNISRVGSDKTRPAPFGNGVVFAAKGGRRLREFAYSESNGSYISKDVNLLSPDVASFKSMEVGTNWYDGKVLEITYDSNRHIVWGITTLGTVIAITYNKEAEVVAWSKHIIGGEYTGTLPTLGSATWRTALGFVPAIGLCTFPGDNNVYLNAVRDVGGTLAADSFQLEVIGEEFENTSLISETEPPYFSDGAKALYPSMQGTFDFNDSDVDTANDLINLVAHGLYTCDKVQVSLESGAVALPSPLVASTDYWIIRIDADNYQFAASLADAEAGTAIVLTGIGNDGAGNFENTLFSRKTWTGLGYLEAQTVTILADGTVKPNQIVSSTGTITLTAPAEIVIAGCPYMSEIITKNLHAGMNYETALGAIKRLDRVIARFYKSYAAEINTEDPSDSTKYQEIEFLDPGAGMGDPLTLYSGEKNIYAKGDPEREVRVGIRTDKPLPMTITALVMRGQTYE